MAENHDKIIQWIPFNFKVMIIDEDPTSLIYAAAALKTCHFEVEPFGNPIEALVQLGMGRKTYDLVLVDVNCTKLPGFYLTERIVDHFGIPVITTGIDECSNTKNLSYQHGACFHVTKPLTITNMDYIWKKLWINSPMRNRSRHNEKASSLPETENSKEVEIAKKKLKLFHTDSQFDEHSKGRLVWDAKLNERFKVAVALLGNDAIPSSIIGIMNVTGLSTKHIASHLQKYRFKCEKEKKKSEVQPSVVQLPTSPVHTKSMNTDGLKMDSFKSLSEVRSNKEIMQEQQKESTDGSYNHKQYENNLSSAVKSAPLHNQLNLGFDLQDHHQESTAKYNQFVKNLSSAMESSHLHNQIDLTFERQEESTGQYSQLVKIFRAMENAPLHNQMNSGFELQDHHEERAAKSNQFVKNLNGAVECFPLHNQTNLAYEHQEESTGQYSQLVKNFGAMENAPPHNQMNLGFDIQDRTGNYNQQQYVNNLTNAMESAPIRNQMNLSFDYSSFKVPQPAQFMHSNHQQIEQLRNYNVNSTVVQPYIPVMNHNDNMSNHQPLLFVESNDEWNMDELLGSSNAFEAVQHQDASMMSTFHDADLNFSSDFNNYRNLNFDNDAFLEEMFGNAQLAKRTD